MNIYFVNYSNVNVFKTIYQKGVLNIDGQLGDSRYTNGFLVQVPYWVVFLGSNFSSCFTAKIVLITTITKNNILHIINVALFHRPCQQCSIKDTN